MPHWSVIVENLISGIVNGSLYVVLALGLTLLFGVSRIINIAHGQFFAIGGYLAYLITTHLGLAPPVAILMCIAAGLVIGWVMQHLLIAPLRSRPAIDLPLELFLILTLGLSIFLQNGLLAVFGENPIELRPLIGGHFQIGGIFIPAQWIVVFGAAAALTAALFLFVQRTRIGTAIRAVSQDRDSASSVGIDVGQIDHLVLAISAALGLAAGALAAPIIFVYPSSGSDWLLKAIVVVIMGGLGSAVGALIAGFGLAIVEALATLWMPAQYTTTIGLLLMVVVLMLRPTGLMGRPVESPT